MKTKLIKLKLLSPIIAKGEAPYENPWDGGEDFRILTEPEKKRCRAEIHEAVIEMLEPTFIPRIFERSIFSAVPDIEEHSGRLVLALNCECYRALSEAELDELCRWWENKVIKTSEALEKIRISTKKLGRIYVYIWFLNGWAVEPVFPGEQ